MKTKLRQELQRQKYDQLLLKDASVFNVSKHLYKTYDTQLWALSAVVAYSYIIWSRV